MRSAWRSSALPLGEAAVEVPAQELADGAGVADGVLGRLDRRVGLLGVFNRCLTRKRVSYVVLGIYFPFTIYFFFTVLL
jgi:hypothetical protein